MHESTISNSRQHKKDICLNGIWYLASKKTQITLSSRAAQQLLTCSFCKQLQAKLYLSIIDDVIESMRELFLDEGLEDRILDDLRHVSYSLHNSASFEKSK